MKIDKLSEEQLKRKIDLILEKIFIEKDKVQEKLQQLQACTKTIISIKNKRFSEISTEFYILFDIKDLNRTNIGYFMQDFHNLTQIFTNLINEKLNSMVNLDLFSYYKNLSNVQKKIEENIDLSYHDLFKILDKQGRRVVKPGDLLQFLKRLPIDITHHRLREILVKIKREVINMETCLINFQEFKEIMQQLNKQSILLSLTYLGISKQQLFVALLVTVIYLGLVLTFILIGVQALAIPGTFAAIINAILPMIGGFGLNKQSKNKQIRTVNQNTIMESVKKAIKIISEKTI
ncbi:unnamed protein product [Paramecium sonneborni]|uniref:Uncharacterized protein n=1 Tax=Paramecium sonneborni TaxID=65129 RepID=A0A8S1QYI8_9CILI|nr:unnamed protein product [Paramecium sonneborni]